jgi:2-methylcitrate dehydratase PrpD
VYFTEALAQYVLNLSIDNLDSKIITQAKHFFSDGMACMVAGAKEKPVRIALDYAKKYGGTPEAYIICSDIKTDAVTAAMADGIAAHIHDYDDVSDSSNAHVGVVILPTVLTLGQLLHVSGKKSLEAFIAGIEVTALAGRAMGKENFRRGWHSTSSLGIFGAAAAAGKLMKLTEQQLVFAFGIAASESSGIKANFGTMTKPFHAGSAAGKGIRAARLASLGYESNPSCIEDKCGFADLTIGETDMTPAIFAMEQGISEFIDPGLIMKPYPACKGTHNGIDAMRQLRREYRLRAEDIAHITAEVQPYVLDLLRFPVAKTKYQGKFSLNYCMAQIIMKGDLKLEDFDGDLVEDPEIIALMKRMDVISNDHMNAGDNMLVRGDTIVTVETKDGKVFSCRVNYATGDPHCPLTEEMRMEKLQDCLSRTLVPARIEEVLNMLECVEELPDLSVLAEILSQTTRKPNI